MKAPIQLPWSEREPILNALEALAPGEGVAEHESNDPKALLRYFLPTPSFRRALNPNAMLIVGERGAGKTELFRVLGSGQGYAALGEARQGQTLKLIAGFGRILQQQTDQPDATSVQNTLGTSDDSGWRAFWVGMLVARLLKGAVLQAAALPPEVVNALANPSRVDQWLPVVRSAFNVLITTLDNLDGMLLREKRAVVVAYDELDRIVPNYPGLFPPVRVLLSLWLDWWRRWQCIRPKIIIRTDLWESRLLAFPDASKLSGHKVELEWSRPYLYRMAIKRMLNGPPVLAEFAKRGATAGGHALELQVHTDPPLGVEPVLNEAAFADVITALVGEYMGANPRKGWSYDWIPNHVADSQGRVLPRPFLKLLALTARSALDRASSTTSTQGPLLVPADFASALIKTSEVRLQELEEERAWLKLLRPEFKGGTVPMERAEVLSRLHKISWPNPTDAQAPPTTDAERLLEDYLVKLGIMELRSDGRLNVPDIYRHGLSLARKGGVARKAV